VKCYLKLHIDIDIDIADISTPADIARSALETILFCCFMAYMSALTYYLLLSLIKVKQYFQSVF